jgi:hypothetical protein
MDRRQRIGLVCVLMLLGSSCSSEDNAATDPDPAADGSAALSSAAGQAGTLGDPTVRSKLRDLALQASSNAGVPSPRTMIAVASPDHQAAEQIVSGDIVNDHAPVYVVVMTGGTYTADMAPPGVADPQGSVLTLTVDAATFRITDVGIIGVEPDLSKIASVITDLSAE